MDTSEIETMAMEIVRKMMAAEARRAGQRRRPRLFWKKRDIRSHWHAGGGRGA